MNKRIPDRRYLLIALGLTLLIRSTIFSLIYPDTEIITFSDQSDYLRLAEHISQYWNFGIDFGSDRMPLYPLFITLCQIVSENLFFLLAVQNLIGLLSVYFLYKIGLLFSRRAAIIASFLAAVDLNFVVLSNSILTESIFYPIFCLFYLELFKYSRNKNGLGIFLTGFLLGVCTLIRHAAMFLPPVIISFILLHPRIRLADKLRHSVYFSVILIVLLGPWIYRNYILFGHAGITSQGEAYIIGWIVPSVMQYEEKMDLKQAEKKSVQLWKVKKRTLSEKARNNPFLLDKEAKKYGAEYLLSSSPLSVARAWFWGAMKNIFSPVTIELAYMFKMDWTHFYETPGKSFPEQAWNFVFQNKNKVYSIMLISGILAMLLLRLVQAYGVWRLFHEDREIFILCGLLISYFLIVSGPVGYAKYRVPFEPVLILFTTLLFCAKKDNGGYPTKSFD